jgi:hypothetical protein
MKVKVAGLVIRRSKVGATTVNAAGVGGLSTEAGTPTDNPTGGASGTDQDASKLPNTTLDECSLAGRQATEARAATTPASPCLESPATANRSFTLATGTQRVAPQR